MLLGCHRDSGSPSAAVAEPMTQSSDSAIRSATSPETQPESPAWWSQQYQAILVGESDLLVVEERPISEAEISQLATLEQNLEQLLIDAGGVSDASMKTIGRLSNLRHLRIRHSDISDQGITNLLAGAELPSLQILNLPHSSLTAAGITQLAKLPQLRQLRIGGRQIDDHAVELISQLPELRSLHLIGPQLTSKSLEALAESPHLNSFYLDDCPLPDPAWEQLFAAKPNLHVHVDQHHHDRDPHPDQH